MPAENEQPISQPPEEGSPFPEEQVPGEAPLPGDLTELVLEFLFGGAPVSIQPEERPTSKAVDELT